MKLFEALAKRKTLQTEIAELTNLRQETFQHADDEFPELNYGATTKNLGKLVSELRNLKLRIMNANIATKLPNGTSLAEAIIAVADIRAEIQNLRELTRRERGLYGRTRQARTDLKMVPQATRVQVLDQIRILDTERVQLDKFIAEANQSVEV